MKTISLATALLAACVSLASAGVVITPVRADQVVPKSSEDCFFGVTTPQGCAYVLAVLRRAHFSLTRISYAS
jgi:hypothetical protein